MSDEFNPFDRPGKVLDLSGVPPLGKFTIRGLKPGLLRQMESLQAEVDAATGGEIGDDALKASAEAVRAVCRMLEIALIGGREAGVADVLVAAYEDDANEAVTFGTLMDAQGFVQAALGVEEVEAPNA